MTRDFHTDRDGSLTENLKLIKFELKLLGVYWSPMV